MKMSEIFNSINIKKPVFKKMFYIETKGFRFLVDFTKINLLI